MKKFIVPLLLVFILFSRSSAEEPINIGLTLGLTGKYANMGDMQRKGFMLWESHVNEEGGILGRKVQLVVYDDKSDPQTAMSLYEKLISEDKVEFLFGPYSSGITAAIAPVAEKHGYPVLVSGASADSLWQKGYRYLFGVYTPASKYTVGFLEMLVTNGIDTVAIAFSDDPFSRSIAEGTRKWAKRFELKVLAFEMFKKGRVDLDDVARQARESGAETLVVCGHFNEAVNMKSALKRIKWYPEAYFASVGPVIQAYYDQLKSDAEYTFSASQWEYHDKLQIKGAKLFYESFRERFGIRPSYHAATAYAGGEILKEAIIKAASFKREKIREMLATMDTIVIIGRYGVDSHGMQVRHFPVIVQWQNGNKEIVWPKEFRTAAPNFSSQ